MKTVAIYFSSPGVLDYPLNKQMFFESYTELIEKLKERDVHAVVVRGNSYHEGGIFHSYFEWNGESFDLHDKAIKVDLIFNRDDQNIIPEIRDCPVLNHPDFDEICRDKVKTYEVLGEFCAKTFVVHSYKEALEHLGEIPGGKVVVKPRFGEQAQGVYVLDKSELKESLYASWDNILLQEFLDSSVGIPDVVEGLHEINVCVVNGSFAGARYKTPPQGSFITSATGQAGAGGTVQGLSFDQVPERLWRVVESLDTHLESFSPRLYRADFIHTEHGYRLVEINSRPGLMHPTKEGKFYWDFNGAILECLSDI